MGLTFGLHPLTLVMKLPIIGRLGISRTFGPETSAEDAIAPSPVGDEQLR
jgi:hypothetical protein